MTGRDTVVIIPNLDQGDVIGVILIRLILEDAVPLAKIGYPRDSVGMVE